MPSPPIDRSTHAARSCAPASSTFTRTTTRSCCGIRPRARRRCTASRPCSAATAASRSRRSGRTTADYVKRMMARVEGMPLDALEGGGAWDWRGFGEYLDRLEGRIAVNAGFLVGHSTVRRVVMGDDGNPTSAATPDQVDAMVALLGESLGGGRARVLVVARRRPRRRRRPARAVARRRLRGVRRARRGSARRTRARPSSSSRRSVRSRRSAWSSWPTCRWPPTVRSTGTCWAASPAPRSTRSSSRVRRRRRPRRARRRAGAARHHAHAGEHAARVAAGLARGRATR